MNDSSCEHAKETKAQTTILSPTHTNTQTIGTHEHIRALSWLWMHLYALRLTMSITDSATCISQPYCLLYWRWNKTPTLIDWALCVKRITTTTTIWFMWFIDFCVLFSGLFQQKKRFDTRTLRHTTNAIDPERNECTFMCVCVQCASEHVLRSEDFCPQKYLINNDC